jgi:hypothetical protein
MSVYRTVQSYRTTRTSCGTGSGSTTTDSKDGIDGRIAFVTGKKILDPQKDCR